MPLYKRATVMQASLAIVGLASGMAVWLLRGGEVWLIGAVLVGLVVPFTFIVIMPTNKQLLSHFPFSMATLSDYGLRIWRCCC